MRQVHSSAWLLAFLSAILQILIFPLPNLYVLCWIAVAPLLIALLRARTPDTLQLKEGAVLLPARPAQGFLLGYICGILWYAGTCYWIYPTMRQYGGVNTPAAIGILILFCLYLAIYHGAFGLLISIIAKYSKNQTVFVLAPAVWVAVELARTRISGFPWDLLGITQVDNVPLARIATVTGVYGISFEIMLVNTAFATAFLVHKKRRKQLLFASLAAVAVLQAARWLPAPSFPVTKTAYLVQANVPILEASDWTKEYFTETLRELSLTSLSPGSTNTAGNLGSSNIHPDLIAWPESPAPFYTSDPIFRDGISNIAKAANTWVLVGAVGIRNASANAERPTEIYNSAALVSPKGEWTTRYDKVHLVPFGEYVPFEKVFSFASGLTKEVGTFSRGESRRPLLADATQLGAFICYESIFPDEIRQSVRDGAQVLVNISNDGWYGDSGAYAQHLRQARMRAIENNRWLLRDTNTGATASIDPYGRIVAEIPRKIRATLVAPYGLLESTTFYTRYGDWFAYVCAIILVVALLRFAFPTKAKT